MASWEDNMALLIDFHNEQTQRWTKWKKKAGSKYGIKAGADLAHKLNHIDVVELWCNLYAHHDMSRVRAGIPPETNVQIAHINREQNAAYVIRLDTSPSVVVWVTKDASAHFQTGRNLEPPAPSGKLAPQCAASLSLSAS